METKDALEMGFTAERDWPIIQHFDKLGLGQVDNSNGNEELKTSPQT